MKLKIYSKFEPQLYTLSEESEFHNDSSYINFISPLVGNQFMIVIENHYLQLYTRTKSGFFEYASSFWVNNIKNFTVTDKEISFSYTTQSIMDNWEIMFKFKKVR